MQIGVGIISWNRPEYLKELLASLEKNKQDDFEFHLFQDGSVCKFNTSEKDRNITAIVGYYNNNQRLLDEFKEDFSKLFGVKMKMRKNISVCIRSIRRYSYFIDNFGLHLLDT